MDNEAIRKQLVAKADAQMARWPQYKGHFDGYVVVRVKKDLKTKMGLAFAAGEVAIASPAVHFPDGGPYTKIPFVTVYSSRNACDTSIRKSQVEFL